MSMKAANRLARICASSHSAPEWEQFVYVVTPVVALSVRRVAELWGDASHTTVLEIVQEVFLKLCEDERRILREFEDRGNDSFLKLLRTIATRTGTDHFRRIQAEKRGGRPIELSGGSGAPREIADERAVIVIERPSLMAQLDRLLLRERDQISLRDRNLFWLYYRHGLSMQTIARIPDIGLSEKGVESALKRIRKVLRETIVNGKQKKRISERKVRNIASPTGFSPAIAITPMKQG
jgi:RNA polymerase sigma-70 factor (ECF subfamily)